jgi:hypothetical protein
MMHDLEFADVQLFTENLQSYASWWPAQFLTADSVVHNRPSYEMIILVTDADNES